MGCREVPCLYELAGQVLAKVLWLTEGSLCLLQRGNAKIPDD